MVSPFDFNFVCRAAGLKPIDPEPQLHAAFVEALDELDPFVHLLEASEYIVCDCGEIVELDNRGNSVDHDRCWAAGIAQAEDRADQMRHTFGNRA